MLIVGEKEMSEGQVAVRRQGKGDLGAQPVGTFMAAALEEINSRKSE
jgi:threonyl-tRNA synthetase